MRGLAVIACVAMAACYAPSAREGAPCGPGEACPSGQVCDQGVCLLTARDDAAVNDARRDGAATDAPPDAYVTCGGPTLFTDPFDNTSAGPLFEATAGTDLTVVESADHVDVGFAPSVVAPSYGFYSSKISYTTAGLCVRVEISDLADANAVTFFKLSFGNSEAEFFASNGTLQLRSKDASGVTSHKSFATDVVSHRYWRLRFEGTTTYWDTSPDDITYTEQTSIVGAFPATSGYVIFGAGAATDVSNGDKARFESVKATGS